MHISEPILIGVIGLLGMALGGGGLYAWFKIGPERRRLTADTNSTLLRDAREAYQQLSDELSQTKMTNIMLENECDNCRDKVFQLEHVIQTLQEDISRHGRMSEIARRRAHLAINTLGNYELHIELLLDRMRAENVVLNALDRPIKLRREFQAKMNELEKLESLATTQALAEYREIPITDSDDSASE